MVGDHSWHLSGVQTRVGTPHNLQTYSRSIFKLTRRVVTHLKEVYYRLRILNLDLTHKTNPIDNCLEWSPNIPRMVTHQPKDGHPTEGSILQTRNLSQPSEGIILQTQNLALVN